MHVDLVAQQPLAGDALVLGLRQNAADSVRGQISIPCPAEEIESQAKGGMHEK